MVGTMSNSSVIRVARRRWSDENAQDLLAGESARSPLMWGLARRVRALDRKVAERLRPLAFPTLRVLLGILFVWFGALKVVGASPVEAIVAGTLPWAAPGVSVTVLGAVEVALGAALVTGFGVRLVLPALAAHLTGTFLTFVMLPELMFRGHNPLLLTESGEFVTKNLVLIAATLVLIAHAGGQAKASRSRPRTQSERQAA
jgi:putative oxidoreductase